MTQTFFFPSPVTFRRVSGESNHLRQPVRDTRVLIAMAETHHDIVRLAAFCSPADRGVWINRLFLIPAGSSSLTDGSGRYPVPLDAHPFRIVVRTVLITASLGGYMDTEALAAPVSSLVELTFALLRVNRPWNIRTWTEVSDGVDTAVASVAQEASTVQPVTQNDPGSSSCQETWATK